MSAVEPPLRVPPGVVPFASTAVAGFDAVVLERALRLQMPVFLREYSPDRHAQLRALAARLEFVKSAYLDWDAERRKALARVNGSTEAPRPEVPAPLSEDGMTTERAAEMLGVTDSRVRQRCRAKELGARRVGGRWVVSVSAVTAELESAGVA